MGNQKDFYFSGLVFNNKNKYEIISNIDSILNSFYNDNIYLFSTHGDYFEEFYYNGVKELIKEFLLG